MVFLEILASANYIGGFSLRQSRIVQFFLTTQNIDVPTQICCFNYFTMHGKSFHPSLLPFLFTWWMKRWEIVEDACVDELYGLYLLHHANGQMHVYLIASSVKIINKRNVLAMTQFKSTRMVSCWDLYSCSCADLPIQLLLKSLSNTCNDRLVDFHYRYVLIHIMNYKICNILCSNR